MALKLEIDTLEGVDESVKGLYEQQGDKFRLKVEGVEDVSGLKAKNAELLAELKAKAAREKEASEAARKAAEDAAKKSGDVEALEKSWQDKLAKSLAERDEKLSKYEQQINDLTVGQTASSLASELAVTGSAAVLMPHIKARLGMDVRDGKAVAVVLDKEGKPSALTVDELKAEFLSDPAFAPLIVGSKATGGGAAGGRSGLPKASQGDLGGDKAKRVAALKQRFPDLN